jgi:HEAT repeat protein
MKPLNLNLAAVIALLLASPSLLPAQDEAAQLALLKKPGATLEQKQNACRDLALVGTAQSVPVLAGLLGEAELSHMARYALEPIPAPEVDTALRDALGTVKGRLRLGVIRSIGVRRDNLATPALAKLLTDPDPEVARSAALALGEIGTIEAVQSLQSHLKGASPSQFQAMCDGLFRGTESLAAGKASGEDAFAIFKRLLTFPEVPQQVRTAALRGAVRTDEKSGMNLLAAALRGDDEAMFSAAVGIAMERRGPVVTATLVFELPKLPAERQILVIGALAQRGDAAGALAVMKLLDTADVPVRVAAVKALTRFAYVPVVPVLAKLALAEDGELRVAARECLASFPDPAADASIAKFLVSSDPEIRRLGTELIGLRSTDVAVPALLNVAATDQEDAVRVAALTVLRDLAGTGDLEALVQILLKTKSGAVTKSVTHALVVVCAREPVVGSEPSPACVDPLVAGLKQSSGPARQALLQVLGRVGGTCAQEAVRAATGEGDGKE